MKRPWMRYIGSLRVCSLIFYRELGKRSAEPNRLFDNFKNIIDSYFNAPGSNSIINLPETANARRELRGEVDFW